MTIRSAIAAAFSALALGVLAIGCSSPKQNGQLLSAAGFRIVPATTPGQRAHLQTLQTGKITKVVRQGIIYYVYPDKQKEALYVGEQSQFDTYQELRLDNRLQQERMRAAQMNHESAFAPWGEWSSTGFIQPIPPIQR